MRDEPRLRFLAERIERELGYVTKNLESARNHAIRAGEHLLEARESVSPGEWQTWLSNNTACTIERSNAYMRLAHWKELLPAELGVSASLAYLSAMDLPNINGRVPYPQALRDEATRLHKENGSSFRAIGKLLGVPNDTVGRWIRGHSGETTSRNIRRQAERRRAVRADRELRRLETEQLLRQKKSPLAESYSRLRLASESIANAAVNVKSMRAQNVLRSARSRTRSAQDLLKQADALIDAALSMTHHAEDDVKTADGYEYGRDEEAAA